MALTITEMPDCKAALGPSQFERSFQFTPGFSDYPSSGYPITAAALGLGNLYGGWVIGANATAETYGAKFVTTSPSTAPQAESQLLFYVDSAGTQVSVGGNLLGCSWVVRVLAQGE